jgi:hypothetical protein
MAVELSIHGLRPPPAAAALTAAGYGACCSAASSSPAGVVLQPGSGHLVLPAEHANLQFFDVARDRHIARLQVRGPGLFLGWTRSSTPSCVVVAGDSCKQGVGPHPSDCNHQATATTNNTT